MSFKLKISRSNFKSYCQSDSLTAKSIPISISSHFSDSEMLLNQNLILGYQAYLVQDMGPSLDFEVFWQINDLTRDFYLF